MKVTQSSNFRLLLCLLLFNLVLLYMQIYYTLITLFF